MKRDGFSHLGEEELDSNMRTTSSLVRSTTFRMHAGFLNKWRPLEQYINVCLVGITCLASRYRCNVKESTYSEPGKTIAAFFTFVLTFDKEINGLSLSSLAPCSHIPVIISISDLTLFCLSLVLEMSTSILQLDLYHTHTDKSKLTGPFSVERLPGKSASSFNPNLPLNKSQIHEHVSRRNPVLIYSLQA